MSDCSFTRRVFRISTDVGTLLLGCYMAGTTRNCCRLGAFSVYTIQPCTSLQCHFIRSHRHKMQVCLSVTCHLHFWQNSLDLLSATMVTRSWNKHQNRSQRINLTLEKNILPPLLSGLEPETFSSRVRRVTAVAWKISRSFCQKCRRQATAKHAFTLRTWLCMR